MNNIKRVIPCLDIQNGRVVKGVHFVNIRDAADPVEAATRYAQAGADELVMLDIDATVEGRGNRLDMIGRVAQAISIPFAVGGGISDLKQIEEILKKGAGKVGINSAALKRPAFVKEAAREFGSKAICLAVDVRTKPEGKGWDVVSHGGQVVTGWDAADWSREVESLGAGEILLTSMDGDGALTGYDIGVTRYVADAVSIPVIASGGAGKLEHFYDAIVDGHADAVLAASLFHFGTIGIGELKEYLAGRGIAVRQ